ncbi:adenylyltransferase/sulfurtransferase MoeZ [Fodinibacter luteus]|uniref:Adenylyltransferase/sulfurtransferase MoeZ n=1 Tax=Fodinibacter luteus TaxID=552064 RepID=A0ABP8KA16_9MICO
MAHDARGTPLVSPAPALTPGEVHRYSRHLLIPDVGVVGQRRLRAAKVLVVGAGGLGSPAALYLAAAGIGTIGLLDFDVVDESNQQRQVIHGEKDVGRPKVESARDAVGEVNAGVEVVVHRERLDASNALDILEAYDLVVDGTDNFATRYLINDACVLLHKPYVWASIFRFDGQLSVFWADRGPCYRCLYPEPPPPGMVPSCAEGGVLGALCGVLGSMQVVEAVKLIVGFGEPLIGRLVVHDALSPSTRVLRFDKDPRCAACGPEPTVTSLQDYEDFCGVRARPVPAESTISARELAVMLERREGGEGDFVLIDVREPAERDIVAVPGSVALPMGRFRTGSALADLPHDRPVVLLCKSGVRSAEALALLHDAGHLGARHVEGGVLAWVSDVDPSLPAY